MCFPVYWAILNKNGCVIHKFVCMWCVVFSRSILKAFGQKWLLVRHSLCILNVFD